MRILGIDPGLQICGYGCVQAGPDRDVLVEAGVFRTSPKSGLDIKLNQIAEDTESLLKRFNPDIVAAEQLYSHYEHPKTAILMGHARGVILQKCAQAQIEVRSFSATRIKKAVTGNGRASKEQVQKAVQALLLLPDLPKPPDVADAIAAAICCAHESNVVV